jgi:hypothetical protein
VRGFTNYSLGDKSSAITDFQTAASLFEKDGNAKMAKQSLDMIKQVRNG